MRADKVQVCLFAVQTYVEEIGLVPLAEEALRRHVLQLLPGDPAAQQHVPGPLQVLWTKQGR